MATEEPRQSLNTRIWGNNNRIERLLKHADYSAVAR